MKKKLTVNSIALSNLKSHKKQYFLMIIGVILAMIFSSGTLFFLSALNASEREMKNKAVGSQSIILINTDDKRIEKIKESGLAEDIGFAHTIGYAYLDKNTANKGTYIAWLDDECRKISYQSLLEGKFPETENEIAIERGALLKLGLDSSVGDSITLSVLAQNGDATVETPVKKTYKLVGILSDKRSNISYSYSEGNSLPAAFVCKNTLPESGGKERLDAYLGSEKSDKLFIYIYDNQLNNDETWSHLFNTTDTPGSTNLASLRDKIGLAVLLTVVLLAVSCLGIINSFNTNLRERKKQIGMLRAVGATRRQIIHIFGREAFIIGIVCVPLSLAVSYFGVKGIVSLIGDELFLPFDLRIFVLCGVFSIISVMLASMIPLFAASRITPIQAIRNISVLRKVKEKHIRTQKSFIMPKLLAKRNIAFYKTRHIIMCVILAVTVALSSFGFSMYNLAAEDNYDFGYDYQILQHSVFTQYINDVNEKTSGFNESAFQRVASIPYAGEVYGIKSCMAVVLVDEFTDYLKSFGDDSPFDQSDYFNAENPTAEDFIKLTRTKFDDSYLELKQKLGFDKELYRTEIGAFSEKFIEKYIAPHVVEGKIDIDKINSGEEIILFAPERVGFSVGIDIDGGYHYGPVYNENIEKDNEVILTGERDIKAGDTLNISILSGENKNEDGEMISLTSDTVRNDRTVTVGAIVDEIPDDTFGFGGVFTEPCFNLITTASAMNLYSENESYDAILMNLNCECNDEINNEIEQILNDISLTVSDGWINSQYEADINNQRSNQVLLIAMLAIIILFFSICASIINNSITANIRESKREIGTLRAVGASLRELFGSYVRQVFTALSIGCGSGFAVYLIGYAIISLGVKYNIILEKIMAFSPWETLGACLILFAVCCVNLFAKIRKEMKNSIVDNIREL